MRNHNINKIKFFFSFLLVLVLSISTASAILMEYHNTNDDNDNAIGQSLWSAQTFTVGNTGYNNTHNVTGVRLKIRWDGASLSNVTVSIRATDPVTEKPTGADLTNVTIDVTTLPIVSTWCWFNFTSSYQLIKGEKYAIVMGTEYVSTGGIIWRMDTAPSPYTGGHALNSVTNGTTWGVLLTADYMFEEYGEVHPVITDAHPHNNTFDVDPSLDGTGIWNFTIQDLENDVVNYTISLFGWNENIGDWTAEATYSGNTNGINISTPTTFTFNCNLCYNTNYSYYVNISYRNDAPYAYSNSYPEGFVYGDETTYYNFRTINSSLPVVTINYPVDGATYTKTQWEANHLMNYTISDAEGDLMDVGIVFTDSIGSVLPVYTISDLSNGTYTLDIEPYIWLDDMGYNITIYVTDDYSSCSLHYASAGTNMSNFTIGSYNERDYVFAIRDIDPRHMDFNDFELSHGYLTFDIFSNHTIDFFWFVTDYGEQYSGMGSDNWTMVRTYGKRVFSSWDWSSYSIKPNGGFLPRHLYSIFVGVPQSIYPYADTHLSNLYTKCEEGNFTSLYRNVVLLGGERTGMFITPGYGTGLGFTPYIGYHFIVGTYPPGVTPDTDISAGVETLTPGNVGDKLSKIGIPGLGIVVALLIIAVFSIMPIIAQYTVFKPHHKTDVPPYVIVIFAAMGVMLCYEMELLPIWIIAFGFNMMLVFIMYRFASWVLKSAFPQTDNISTNGGET